MVVFLKWSGFIVAALVLVGGIVAAIGARQPVRHVVSKTETFPVAQEKLWQISLAAFERMNDGTYAIVEQRAPHHLVTAIVDKKLPYGGAWTYEFLPAGEGTTLTVVEQGEVYNPLFRFVSRYVIGHTRSIDGYFADVRKSAAGENG